MDQELKKLNGLIREWSTSGLSCFVPMRWDEPDGSNRFFVAYDGSVMMTFARTLFKHDFDVIYYMVGSDFVTLYPSERYGDRFVAVPRAALKTAVRVIIEDIERDMAEARSREAAVKNSSR